MKSFELKIIKPTKKDVFNVEWVDVQTPTGNFFIGYGHNDLISILKNKASFTYKKVDQLETESMNAYNGYLKIENGTVLIILDI